MEFLLILLSCTLTLNLVRAKTHRVSSDSVISIPSNFYDDNYDETDSSMPKCAFGFQKYRPDRRDCNRFYICNSGNDYRADERRFGSPAMVGICPPDMWFDIDHTDDDEVICTHYEVICATERTEMYEYCNCKTIEAAVAAISAQHANIATNELLEVESIDCIVDNEFHLFESENDCERYYVCFNTKVYPMQCKPGLHFNSVMKYCDVPEKAQCKLLNQNCPPTGISLVSNPHDCNSFYYCYFGKKTLQMCEFYHIWDDKSKSCVRRDQAACHSDGLN